MLDPNAIRHGVICLTFDDQNFADWTAALPLFAAYNARVTFSVSGPIDAAASDAMKELHAAGHTVGLHTLSHADAPEFFAKKGADAYLTEQVLPQLDACRAAGLKIGTFAYPNNRHNAETDAALSQYFQHFRAGLGFAVCPKEDDLKNCDAAFVPVSLLPGHTVMCGRGIGDYYSTRLPDILSALDRASARNECITFFSHGIHPDARHVHMPTATLTAILDHASTRGLTFAGLDDLPR